MLSPSSIAFGTVGLVLCLNHFKTLFWLFNCFTVTDNLGLFLAFFFSAIAVCMYYVVKKLDAYTFSCISFLQAVYQKHGNIFFRRNVKSAIAVEQSMIL